MNSKDYKKKVAEIFQFKSPKSNKFKKITAGDKDKEAEGEASEDSTMASSSISPKPTSNIAQFSKKRDVIVIGAGLSGKWSTLTTHESSFLSGCVGASSSFKGRFETCIISVRSTLENSGSSLSSILWVHGWPS